ncbi:MAG TPA: hypothetical protein VLC95_20235 [Anaerolineae bacterium]|nr:hypothetical protein [Anaerolineae bacterium]
MIEGTAIEQDEELVQAAVGEVEVARPSLIPGRGPQPRTLARTLGAVQGRAGQ